MTKKQETKGKEAKKEAETPNVLKEVVQEVKEKKGDRAKRWEKFLDSYKVQNPVKFATKEEAGEFKEIPASFK